MRPDDLNLDPERAREAVTGRTKAILPVHLAGQPCDLEPLWELGLPVVEDAAHAVEASYRGRKLGGLSDATCFSLYATKNVAAGEGGLVATNRDDVAAAIDDLRVMRRGHGSLYDIPVPGYKANLSDVLASIALVQLDKLERAPGRFASATSRPTTRPSPASPGSSRSRAIRATRTRSTSTSSASTPRAAGGTRDDYQRLLAEEQIGTSVHFLPVHTLTAYRDRVPDRAAAAGGGAGGRGGRSRSRSRRRTRTTTSPTRSPRCAACTRGSRRERDPRQVTLCYLRQDTESLVRSGSK